MNYKVMQVGCGKLASYLMRYVIEDGGEIIGAVDNDPDLLGMDIAKIASLEEKSGIEVNRLSDLEDLIKSGKPDIAIIATDMLLEPVAGLVRTCVENHLNVIIAGDEALYPANSNPNLYQQLDALAKEYQCTISGGGYYEGLWGTMVSSLAASTHTIKTISGHSILNIDDFGAGLCQAYGIGLTKAAFEKAFSAIDELSDEKRDALIKNGQYVTCGIWNFGGWVSDKYGLHLKSQHQLRTPILAETDISSIALGKKLKKGCVIGMHDYYEAQTKAGITINIDFEAKILNRDEISLENWQIEGEPNKTITMQGVNGLSCACAAIVNRIPEVVKATPGYIPSCRLGELKFRK